jgi:hypothetical protein
MDSASRAVLPWGCHQRSDNTIHSMGRAEQADADSVKLCMPVVSQDRLVQGGECACLHGISTAFKCYSLSQEAFDIVWLTWYLHSPPDGKVGIPQGPRTGESRQFPGSMRGRSACVLRMIERPARSSRRPM